MPFEDTAPAPSLAPADPTGLAWRQCLCGVVCYCRDVGVSEDGRPTGTRCLRCGAWMHDRETRRAYRAWDWWEGVR